MAGRISEWGRWDFPCADLFPKWPHCQSWASLKPVAQSFIRVSHAGVEPQRLETSCFLRHIPGRWIAVGGARTQTGAHVRCQYHRMWLNLLCHNTNPKKISINHSWVFVRVRIAILVQCHSFKKQVGKILCQEHF